MNDSFDGMCVAPEANLPPAGPAGPAGLSPCVSHSQRPLHYNRLSAPRPSVCLQLQLFVLFDDHMRSSLDQVRRVIGGSDSLGRFVLGQVSEPTSNVRQMEESAPSGGRNSDRFRVLGSNHSKAGEHEVLGESRKEGFCLSCVDW